MNLPRVVIDGDYNAYLTGQEVAATILEAKEPVQTGTRVMAFHNSIAGRTIVPTPRNKQSHYVGIEGRVTSIQNDGSKPLHVRIVKI